MALNHRQHYFTTVSEFRSDVVTMGHSFAASVSKSWNAIIIVFITSCRFYIALSASGDRFHHERNPSTEGLSLQDVVKSKLLMSKGEGKQILNA